MIKSCNKFMKQWKKDNRASEKEIQLSKAECKISEELSDDELNSVSGGMITINPSTFASKFNDPVTFIGR